MLAGIGFMLPGLCLMLFAAWAYVTLIAGRIGWSGLLLGIQIAVLAIILRAVFRIGEHILEDRLTWLVAIGSGGLTLMGVPFWLPLVAGGAIYALSERPVISICIALVALGIALHVHLEPTSAAQITLGKDPSTIAALFFAGLKGGLLTFGGAYTAIPYVRADTVSRGWLSDAAFLDGIALAGVLPAPLVIFATFVGYVAGGFAGGLAITAGMFLPAFAFSLIFFERLEAMLEHPALYRVLEGVAATVVGIIGATFVQLGLQMTDSVTSPFLATTLFCLALAAAWRLKGAWVTPAILVCGAITGLLLEL